MVELRIGETTDKTQRARAVIRDWLSSREYPEQFKAFFFHWTLLNLYYNALSKEKKEIKRVLEFGRKHENLFESVKICAEDLVKTECVGSKIGPAPPNGWVKTATLQLRDALNVDGLSVCGRCREEKETACRTVKLKQHDFGNMEALMSILYQIRCNLFHGEKTEHTNGNQVTRNRLLVKIGNTALEKILDLI